MLIALAIVLAFVSGAYGAFSRILTTHDRAEARLEALRNARSAITTISDDLKAINTLGSDYLLIGLDRSFPFGDAIDNDADGQIDEDSVTGINDDAGTDAKDDPASDRHAPLNGIFERPAYVGRADLGDVHVDEDSRFGNDAVILRIFPRVPTPELTLKTVTYSIEPYDGETDVLVRRTRIERATGEPLVGVAPLAFGVAGFDLLYWDPNAAPQAQGWVTSWDSSQAANFAPPRLPLPASLYVRLTVNADPRPHMSIAAGEPFETAILETVINIEQIIGDALFPRPDL